MHGKVQRMVGLLFCGFVLVANAGNPQRIGHTTLTPRHSSPDDKGMSAAAIDPTNGYAYFLGTWLFKLDITGSLPVQVGPSLLATQSTCIVVDSAAGYLYQTLTSLKRYAVGTGTNAMTDAGVLGLSAGSAIAVLIDDADANPSNHYAYVLCTVSGNVARIAKVALGTFTEAGSVTLSAGETNGVLGHVMDARHGYAYFVIAGVANTTNSAKVDPLVMTPLTRKFPLP